jgi:polysaccharide pyruvyl transferase WcaK-like protein
MNRRLFFKQTAIIAATLNSLPALSRVPSGKEKTILLCSSWQTFNIGDIAHTPGVLTIFENNLPDVRLILWPFDIRNGVKEMLEQRFPAVSIVQAEQDIEKAFAEADLFVHGSGPSLVGRQNIVRWIEKTGKPFGIYGITFPGRYVARDVELTAAPLDVELLNKAAFVFFRDSVSLAFAKETGITCPIMEFGPDGTFAVDVQNEDAAIAFLKEHGLEEGKFMCCIPRYRYTEEWLAKGKNRPFVQERADINNKMKHHDNGPLRESITHIVRETDMKVLICPEDETHVAIGKSLIFDLLPQDVRNRVVWRDRYWLTDEALSTYKRSAGLFGLEMHSPIMCIGQGIPAVVCRFYEQSTKGYMWRDIGLSDWLFDMDIPEEVEKIVPTVLSIAKDPAAAKKKALEALAYVRKRQKETAEILANHL